MLINRRDLNHGLARVLDQVIATGEPVEIMTRNGPSLLISLKPETTIERWEREGLIRGATNSETLRAGCTLTTTETAEEILDSIRGDH